MSNRDCKLPFRQRVDPIEANLRDRAHEFLQAMLEAELEEALGRSRYARCTMRASGDSEETANVTGHRHGHRPQTLLGTFGQLKFEVPRARLDTSEGKTSRFRSALFRMQASRERTTRRRRHGHSRSSQSFSVASDPHSTLGPELTDNIEFWSGRARASRPLTPYQRGVRIAPAR